MAQTLSQDIQSIVQANERMYQTLGEKENQLKQVRDEQERLRKVFEDFKQSTNESELTKQANVLQNKISTAAYD